MCWVKICGITRRQDAELALALGADALGFVFVRSSPRFLEPREARAMPGFKVGVFEDPSLDEVRRISDEADLDVVQLHGAETPEMCARIDRPIIKAFRVTSPSSLSNARAYDVRAILADGPDWALARAVPNVVVAGGLSATNVQHALARSNAAGVDVSSGLESSPGIKDANRLRAFFEQVKP